MCDLDPQGREAGEALGIRAGNALEESPGVRPHQTPPDLFDRARHEERATAALDAEYAGLLTEEARR